MLADVPTGAWIIWAGALVTWLCAVPYVVDAWHGRIFPSWVSWSVWTATSGLAAAAALAAGSWLGAAVPAAVFLRCAAILVALVHGARRARARGLRRDPPSRLDKACLTACVVIGVVWQATGNPLVALAAAIATDGVAAIPTYRQAWLRQETWGNYAGAAANPLCALLILQEPTFADRAYPTYEFAVNIGLVTVVLLRGQPARGHRRAVAPSRWFQAATVAGATAVMAAAVLLAAGALPVPAASTLSRPVVPAAQVLSPAAPPASTERAVAASAAIPSVGARLQVPPTPGHVALTPDGRQAWIAHRATGVVSVLDTTTGQVVGQVPIPAGPPQYLTFCPGTGRVYVSVYTTRPDMSLVPGAPNVVAVLDMASISQVAEIPVHRRPYAADCSDDGSTLVVPSHDDGVLEVIDTATHVVRESVSVPANPHWVTHTPDDRWWTANHESNVVTSYDPVTFAARPVPLQLPGVPDGVSPHSIAPSPDGRLLAVTCFDSHQVWIVDAATGQPVRAIPTKGQGPQDVSWAPDGRRLYTADVHSDLVSVIDPDAGVVTAWPSPGDGPVSVAAAPDGVTAYVATLHDARVTLLDTAVPAER